MRRIVFGVCWVFLGYNAAAAKPHLPAQSGQASPASTTAGDLASATPEALLKVYAELNALAGSDQHAVTENVSFKRDAGTFTFKNGNLAFAAPVAGHVVAAVFTGEGVFELDPPTGMDRHQIARFTGQPQLVDGFRQAVFYFTDDSWQQLGKLASVRGGGDAGATGHALESDQAKCRERLNDWYDNEITGAFPMRNLAARMLADLSDPSSRGFFLADIKSEHHDDLFYQVSWNRDPLFLPGIANDEEVMLMHWKPGQYAEWWAGFHLAGEYAHLAHPEHLKLLAHASDEQLEADVAGDNRLSATAELHFEVPEAPLRVLPFNLEGVLRISAITDESGKKLSFIQEDRKLQSDPWVILPEPATPGRTYTLKIAYDEDSTRETRIVHQKGAGLYFVTARTSWYPSFGAFNDRTHFVLKFTSPKKFTFVATGRPVSSAKEGKDLVTQWESEIPYSVVGFNYGDFVAKSRDLPGLTVTAYTGRELPDELAGLKAQMDLHNLQSGSLAGGDAEAASGVMVGGLSTAGQAQSAANISAGAFSLFERYFGSLPFKTISVTEQPAMGFGQSWPTLIYLPWDSLLDATTRNSLGLQRSGEAREFYNVVAVHEMSHQWWGHMVGWKTYRDQWMSEGFADFSAALYIEATDPKRFRSFWDLRRTHLLSKDSSGHRPVDVGPIYLNYQTNAYLEPRESTYLIYEKGSYVLEMLRLLVEDTRAKDPDHVFIEIMRDFVSTYAGQNASTADFQRIVEKHLGQPMDWFFNEWVYGIEVPRYDFSYSLKDAGGGKTLLHMAVVQSGVSDSFVMKVPVYYWLNGQARRLGFVQVKGSSTESADVNLPFHPDKMTLDEHHRVLAQESQ
ncbi:MAG TPA: M1 family aminopeptidase [Terriglobia bacterium]|nr:M1 family aminopeptidase [Terriglobia bacterium]